MDYTYLKELEGTLKEIIESPEVPDKKFYQALKDLIDLKLNIEEFNYKFDEISSAMTAMAQGDFTKRIEIPNARNLFAFMGTSINSVIEELERNVVKKGFLETVLETHPLPCIITNAKGTILFSNKAAHALTNYPSRSLIKLIVKNLFVKKLQFGNSDTMDTPEREKVSVSLYYKFDTIEAQLSVQRIYNKHGAIEGYIYLFE